MVDRPVVVTMATQQPADVTTRACVEAGDIPRTPSGAVDMAALARAYEETWVAALAKAVFDAGLDAGESSRDADIAHAADVDPSWVTQLIVTAKAALVAEGRCPECGNHATNPGARDVPMTDPEPVVTVLNSNAAGVMVRWFRTLDDANHNRAELTVTGRGVMVSGFLTDIPDEWVAAARAAHRALRDGADVSRLATHRGRFDGGGGPLDPVGPTP